MPELVKVASVGSGKVKLEAAKENANDDTLRVSKLKRRVHARIVDGPPKEKIAMKETNTSSVQLLQRVPTRGAHGPTFFGPAGPGLSSKKPRPGPFGPLGPLR